MILTSNINETAIECHTESWNGGQARLIAIYRGSLSNGVRITLRSKGTIIFPLITIQSKTENDTYIREVFAKEKQQILDILTAGTVTHTVAISDWSLSAIGENYASVNDSTEASGPIA